MKDLTLWKKFIPLNCRLAIYVLLVFPGLASATTHATMMTYTAKSESSGVIDGTSFWDASITFAMFRDSASASSVYGGIAPFGIQGCLSASTGRPIKSAMIYTSIK